MDGNDSLKIGAVIVVLVLSIGVVLGFAMGYKEEAERDRLFGYGAQVSSMEFQAFLIGVEGWLLFEDVQVYVSGPDGLSFRTDLERGTDQYRHEVNDYEFILIVEDGDKDGAVDDGDAVMVRSNVSMPLGAWTITAYLGTENDAMDRITVVMSDPDVTPIGFLSVSRSGDHRYRLAVDAMQPTTSFSQCFLLVQLGDGWRTIWLNYSQSIVYAYNETITIRIECMQGDGVIAAGDGFIITSTIPFSDADRMFAIHYVHTEGRIASVVF